MYLAMSEVVDFYERIEIFKYLKSYKNGTAYMENGRQIPVSRLRRRDFSNVILQYMKNSK